MGIKSVCGICFLVKLGTSPSPTATTPNHSPCFTRPWSSDLTFEDPDNPMQLSPPTPPPLLKKVYTEHGSTFPHRLNYPSILNSHSYHIPYISPFYPPIIVNTHNPPPSCPTSLAVFTFRSQHPTPTPVFAPPAASPQRQRHTRITPTTPTRAIPRSTTPRYAINND